jgi:hypothetical protein
MNLRKLNSLRNLAKIVYIINEESNVMKPIFESLIKTMDGKRELPLVAE